MGYASIIKSLRFLFPSADHWWFSFDQYIIGGLLSISKCMGSCFHQQILRGVIPTNRSLGSQFQRQILGRVLFPSADTWQFISISRSLGVLFSSAVYWGWGLVSFSTSLGVLFPSADHWGFCLHQQVLKRLICIS